MRSYYPWDRTTMGFHEYIDVISRNLKNIGESLDYKGLELEIYQPDRMGNPEGCYRITNGEKHQDLEASEFYQNGEQWMMDLVSQFIKSLLPMEKIPGSAAHWKNKTPIWKRGREPHWNTPL